MYTYVLCSILLMKDAVGRHLYWHKKEELWGCETKMPKDYILGTLFVSSVEYHSDISTLQRQSKPELIFLSSDG